MRKTVLALLAAVSLCALPVVASAQTNSQLVLVYNTLPAEVSGEALRPASAFYCFDVSGRLDAKNKPASSFGKSFPELFAEFGFGPEYKLVQVRQQPFESRSLVGACSTLHFYFTGPRQPAVPTQ